MRRYLGYSIWQIYIPMDKDVLINACLIKFNSEPKANTNVPFLLTDNFILDLIKTMKVKKEFNLIYHIDYMIGYIEEASNSGKYFLSDGEKKKLSKLKSEYHKVKNIRDNITAIEMEKIPSSSQLLTYLTNMYEQKKGFSKSFTLGKAIDYTITDLLSKDVLEYQEVDLLIGSGGFYYYLANKTELLRQNNRKLKYMAAIYLLSDMLGESPSTILELDQTFYDKWVLFNQTFGRNWDINSWLDTRSLPERYIAIIRYNPSIKRNIAKTMLGIKK